MLNLFYLILTTFDWNLFYLFSSLKAEWMYSQSRGRQFTVGQHTELLEYLLQVKSNIHIQQKQI
jgi:hypothetical protein